MWVYVNDVNKGITEKNEVSEIISHDKNIDFYLKVVWSSYKSSVIQIKYQQLKLEDENIRLRNIYSSPRKKIKLWKQQTLLYFLNLINVHFNTLNNVEKFFLK